MMGIERQSSYYGFTDPGLERHAATVVDDLPTQASIESMLRGNSIPVGSMARTSAVAVLSGSNDEFNRMAERLYELRSSMDIGKVRDTLAKEFYSDPEQQKAFKKGWNASAKPGRDIDKADKMWRNAPSGDPSMNAFYDGWELVSEHL